MAESFYDAAATMVHYVYGDGVVCVVVVGSGYEVVCGYAARSVVLYVRVVLRMRFLRCAQYCCK